MLQRQAEFMFVPATLQSIPIPRDASFAQIPRRRLLYFSLEHDRRWSSEQVRFHPPWFHAYSSSFVCAVANRSTLSYFRSILSILGTMFEFKHAATSPNMFLNPFRSDLLVRKFRRTSGSTWSSKRSGLVHHISPSSMYKSSKSQVTSA